MLYHGTSADYFTRIQNKGLAPRRIAKGRNNWAHTVASNPDAVYLTSVYAWHFAGCATDNGRRGLILEVDRDALVPWKLCPDEDFLEAATRRQTGIGFAPIEWNMKKRLRFYRDIARGNPEQAQASLDRLGTVAYYGVIPWSAVTRYVLIDWSNLDVAMRIRAGDSMVDVLNYRILKERHAAFTRWFFGDPVTAEELTGYGGELPPAFTEMNVRMAEIMQNRSGLEVTDVKRAAPVDHRLVGGVAYP